MSILLKTYDGIGSANESLTNFLTKNNIEYKFFEFFDNYGNKIFNFYIFSEEDAFYIQLNSEKIGTSSLMFTNINLEIFEPIFYSYLDALKEEKTAREIEYNIINPMESIMCSLLNYQNHYDDYENLKNNIEYLKFKNNYNYKLENYKNIQTTIFNMITEEK